MSTELTVFEFQSHPLRVESDEHGNPWYCAKDVCEILGYSNYRDAIARHCKSKGVVKRDTLTEGGKQQLTFIDEGNLYRLIIKSNKPEAEPFESFVCDEVLPSIRKTGSYISDNSQTRQMLDLQTRLVESQQQQIDYLQTQLQKSMGQNSAWMREYQEMEFTIQRFSWFPRSPWEPIPPPKLYP